MSVGDWEAAGGSTILVDADFLPGQRPEGIGSATLARVDAGGSSGQALVSGVASWPGVGYRDWSLLGGATLVWGREGTIYRAPLPPP